MRRTENNNTDARNDVVCRKLTVAYPRGPAVLEDIDCCFQAGQVTAVLGENGSGKSALLKTLMNMIPPRSGEALWGERALTSLSVRERARYWGYLAQQSVPHWSMPVRDVIALGLYARPDWSQYQGTAKVAEVLAATGSESLAARPVLELSAGEQQRVLIARMLVSDPAVILADEPTAGLDPRHQLEVMRLLNAQARNGALVVVVMHDINLAAQFTDQAVLLQNQDVFAQGGSRDVLNQANLKAVFGIG